MLDTLILNRGQVAEVLDPRALLEDLREAFRKYSVERDVSARRLGVPLGTKAPDDASAMIIAPGLISGIPAYTVKVHAKFPGQKPAIQGLIVLHDIETGRPLAVMDSTHITTWRTGLAGALGADVLAREDAAQVAIIGAGVQGEVQLRGLSMVRPIRCARVYDLEPGRSESFCEALSCSVDAVLEPVGSVEEATEGTDIIVTATWATSPFLHDTMVKPGAHINILGADQPGKAEVSATLIRRALFVCDDHGLALEMGAPAGVGLGEEVIDAELGEVIAGVKPGRSDDEQITIFGSVGLAFQDLAAAWLVYQRALKAKSINKFDFLE